MPRGTLRALGFALAAVATASCSATGPSSVAPCPSDAGDEAASTDPLTRIRRLPGSTFLETQEVRALSNGLVLFCSGVRGLNVVDASDPASMERLARLSSSAGDPQYPRCQHVAAAGERIYMANRGDEVQPTPFVAAFDVSDPSTPVELDVVESDGPSFEGLAARDDLVYAAMHGEGVAVLRWREGELQRDGRIEGFEDAVDATVAGQRLYVADGAAGLKIVEPGAGGGPAIVGGVELEGSARTVAVDPEADTAWVAAGGAGLVAVDVADPEAPEVTHVVDTPGLAVDLAVSEGHAWVADWQDVRVFDLAEPSHPVPIATERIETSGDFPRVLGVGARGTVGFPGEWRGVYAYRLHPGREAPDLVPERRRLDFGEVEPGSTASVEIAVRNEGTAPGRVCELQLSGSGAFRSAGEPFELEPGASRTIPVRFEPGSASEARGRLELRTSDPDEPGMRIALEGNGERLGVGDPAPEVAVERLGGGEWRLAEQEGSVVVLSYFATF